MVQTNGEYVTIEEIAQRLNMGKSTAWLFAKRYNLPRYRLPGYGKTSLFRWSDVEQAHRTPRPVEGFGAAKKVIPLAA